MDTSMLTTNNPTGNNKLPATREQCRVMIRQLQSDIAAIKDQIATADLDRQARRSQMDARWYHRARTALRFKREEVADLTAHLGTLPGGVLERKTLLKDAIIETVRPDYDDGEWQGVMDEAHRLLNMRRGE